MYFIPPISIVFAHKCALAEVGINSNHSCDVSHFPVFISCGVSCSSLNGFFKHSAICRFIVDAKSSTYIILNREFAKNKFGCTSLLVHDMEMVPLS